MAEEELFNSMERLSHNCISIMISHRFSTVRSAHRILVLEHGSLVEQGTHDELMAMHCAYKKMYRLHADRYADSAIQIAIE
jgi:ABC-type multidrug transport system fused ATPase/permease subunit